jgi:hypothetical protein
LLRDKKVVSVFVRFNLHLLQITNVTTKLLMYGLLQMQLTVSNEKH